MVKITRMVGGKVNLDSLNEIGELTWPVGINAKGKKGIFPSNYIRCEISLRGCLLMASCTAGGTGLRLSIGNFVARYLVRPLPSQ